LVHWFLSDGMMWRLRADHGRKRGTGDETVAWGT
jgi:hypothetical protein